MKQTIFVLAGMAILALHCGVNKKQPSKSCVQGKIIRISCASYVVQSLNVDTLGQDGWKNMMDTTQVFDNVFDVTNKCKLPNDLKAGDTIYFTVQPTQPSDCVSCMMFDGPPTVKYDLQNVSKQPCQ
ncbi:hypothetical protein [Paraflavitalea sp. CAU 1676]|uniref:hypothetical protein n=1 Tax=Paraflavitalea sp. CAU 1676 TaxID=3032598 RepID=UPI0023DABB62|nr:hypothetical protein [Paraflavitalea sp. CAU 1676]MDF2189524.1 hypothetical protein [Paraflavitalea sp. CAU 1676]